jgi:hypothetical protein
MMKNLLVFLFALLYINVTQAQTQIFVGDVTNGIKIGPMIGNKNLILGLRNIAEEAFMDKGFDIVAKNDSTMKLNMEIVYFDILSTNAGVSVFHKTNAETIIRIKGYLVKDGKKVKEYLATGKSSEISTSTMVIDEGGGINQQAARSALKKTIIELIDKLTI